MTPPAQLLNDGANQYVNGSCTDSAGNQAPVTAGHISVDRTPPTIALLNRPPANAAGWYNADVTITWQCNDNIAGLSTVTRTVSAEGANQAVMAARLGASVTVVTAVGRDPFGEQTIANYRREGVNVQANVYPYTRGNNDLVSIIPPWAHEGGKAELIARLEEPALRDRLKREIRTGLPGWYNHYTAVGGDWGRMLISARLSAPNRAFEGQTMDRILAARSAGGVADQDSNAWRAARTARSTSAGLPAGTRVTTAPSAAPSTSVSGPGTLGACQAPSM